LRLDLGPRLFGGQALENAGLPLATPSDQVRGVKALTALQGADGAGDNLRVRSRQGGRLGRDGLARRSRRKKKPCCMTSKSVLLSV
jgi:hypothetical protein